MNLSISQCAAFIKKIYKKNSDILKVLKLQVFTFQHVAKWG